MQKACVKSTFLHTNEKHAWETFLATIPIGFSCRHLGGVSILTMRNAQSAWCSESWRENIARKLINREEARKK